MSSRSSSNVPTPLRPLLLRLGLQESEIEVYCAVLQLKTAKARDIAKLSKQSRGHTYLILRNLQSKGLLSEVERGKILHFVAESPERLLTYTDDRVEDLRQVKMLLSGAMPLLHGMSTLLIGRPRVTMLSGLEGMKQLYRDTMHYEVCGIFNPESMYNTFGTNLATILQRGDACLRGRDILVNNRASHRFIHELGQRDDYQVRLLPPSAKFNTDTVIFGDSIAWFAYDDEQTIIRIDHSNLATAMRAWFEILWTSSSDPGKKEKKV